MPKQKEQTPNTTLMIPSTMIMMKIEIKIRIKHPKRIPSAHDLNLLQWLYKSLNI
jgi:hypothetical protein